MVDSSPSSGGRILLPLPHHTPARHAQRPAQHYCQQHSSTASRTARPPQPSPLPDLHRLAPTSSSSCPSLAAAQHLPVRAFSLTQPTRTHWRSRAPLAAPTHLLPSSSASTPTRDQLDHVRPRHAHLDGLLRHAGQQGAQGHQQRRPRTSVRRRCSPLLSRSADSLSPARVLGQSVLTLVTIILAGSTSLRSTPTSLRAGGRRPTRTRTRRVRRPASTTPRPRCVGQAGSRKALLVVEALADRSLPTRTQSLRCGECGSASLPLPSHLLPLAARVRTS